jgi:hypothetical protein
MVAYLISCGGYATMKRLDLIGRTFGQLTVLQRVQAKPSAKWLCSCECGATATCSTSNLQSGNSTSCGCVRRNKAVKTMVGDVYGRLTVIERLPNYVSPKKGTIFSAWKCRCSCGNEAAPVLGISLHAGSAKSCGCLKREINRRSGLAALIDLTGRRFGKLTVTRRTKTQSCKKAKWLCECDCGTEVIVSGTSMVSENTLSCGCARENRETLRSAGRRIKTRANGAKRRSAHKSAYSPFDPLALRRRETELADMAKKMEEKTGERWEVEHIVPLRGPFCREIGGIVVCGMHNEHNLMLLSARDNSSKGNRWWPEMPDYLMKKRH